MPDKRPTRPVVFPAGLNSWLAVKEAANFEEKTKKNLKKGSLDKDPASTAGFGSSKGSCSKHSSVAGIPARL